jgi:NADH-quinone oxidoreductase subunit M
VFGAMYLLYMMRRTIFGPPKLTTPTVGDAGPIEMAAIAPLALLLVVLGIFPSLLINVQQPAVELVAAMVGGS